MCQNLSERTCYRNEWSNAPHFIYKAWISSYDNLCRHQKQANYAHSILLLTDVRRRMLQDETLTQLYPMKHEKTVPRDFPPVLSISNPELSAISSCAKSYVTSSILRPFFCASRSSAGWWSTKRLLEPNITLRKGAYSLVNSWVCKEK